MGCNCNCKKSAAQKYNFTAQALSANPAPINMGSTAGLPSGVAIVDRGNNVGIRKTGLYRLTAQLIVAVTAAGTLNVEAYYDGKPLIATRKSLPVPVGSTQIEIDNLLYLVAPEGCACADVIYPIDVYAWMSEAGTGSVSEVAVNLLKEA